ncbi:MAG: hypothetical protein ACR2NZ_07865 [Rubripirellula sp.]
MQLNVNDDRVIVSPETTELESAIRHLGKDEFLVLTEADEIYIQAYHNEDGSFQLEYRAGSADQHFGVDPETISVDDVCRAFSMFVGSDESLTTTWKWLPLELDDDDMESDDVDGGVEEPIVEFQGVMMPESWRGQIEAAQEMTTVSIQGRNLDRIRFGSEQRTAAVENCGDCGVLESQYHVPGCDAEQCPRCGGQLISCDCEIDEE